MNEQSLHGYQLVGIDHIMNLSHCALFLDMGLGKTVITLTAINKLIYEELDVKNALVVAPKRVTEKVWSDEIQKWDHLNHLTYSKIVGNPQQRQDALKKEADIYLISRDNIAWLCGLYGGNMLPFDMLVVDELSSFKNPRSVRFKALRKTQPSFKRVVGLTGTPAPNGLIDLWSQIWLLDRGERLGRTLTEYRQTYFTPGARNGYVVYNYHITKGSDERIHNQLRDVCLSMKSEDYLNLEKPQHNTIKIPMSDSLKKKYEAFEESQVLQLISDVGEKQISAVNAASLSTKLLQFANGAVYDEDRGINHIHDLKIKEAKDLVEMAGGNPVIIAWSFRHDLIRLKKALKAYDPRELKNSQDIQDWNEGKIQVLLTHPASGGHGLNLQAGGNILIWFGQNWSLELYQQLNKRLDRQGQERVVTIHHLITEGTMDEDVIHSLKRKKNKQDGLMDAVKARIEKYA